MRVAWVSVAAIVGLAACRASVRHDGGGAGLDASKRDVFTLDAGPTDAGSEMGDDAPPGYDGGLRRDGGMHRTDAEALVDIGPPQPGEVCETALAWPDSAGVPILGMTSTASLHRDRLSCAGPGAGGDAPDAWWRFSVPSPQHVILRLGTDGFDGVLATRTGTCASLGERCGNLPPVVEIPVAVGDVFVGVGAYSMGAGRYVVSAESDSPLTLAANTTCTVARPIALGEVTLGHNFGGVLAPLLGCAIDDAVYYEVALPAASALSIRAEPRAAQGIGLGLFAEGCGAPAIACAPGGPNGAAATLGPLQLAAGRYAVAVGRPPSGGEAGSFRLIVALDAACRSTADCAIEEACTSALACAPWIGAVASSTMAAVIPDGSGSLDLPLDLAGPMGRPSRVVLRLGLDHPAPEDLVVELVSPPSPTSIRVRLRDREPGALEAVYGQEREAAGPGTMEDFRLLDSAVGQWTLHVEDRARGDSGSVSRYALEVE